MGDMITNVNQENSSTHVQENLTKCKPSSKPCNRELCIHLNDVCKETEHPCEGTDHFKCKSTGFFPPCEHKYSGTCTPGFINHKCKGSDKSTCGFEGYMPCCDHGHDHECKPGKFEHTCTGKFD